jgi:hypothetical protein
MKRHKSGGVYRHVFGNIFEFIDPIQKHFAKKRLHSPNSHDLYVQCARDILTEGFIATMTIEKDLIIREVSEIGFSPYAIFRDVIKDEYHHVYALYFDKIIDTEIHEFLKKYFKEENFQHKTYTSYSKGTASKEKFYYSIQDKMFLSINVAKEDTNIIIMATEDSQNLKDFVAELDAFKDQKKPSMLSIICHNGRGFYTEDFEIKIPVTSGINFFDCYNDEFEDISTTIFEKLSVTEGKGIALFHGGVGTGKTSYLRRLITTIKDKKVIYMPPDLADKIASPEFVTFLMDNPNSILIIEDAENVLRAREAGGSQAISNLLNVSDGILGDALHLQIVCTFNCSTEEIDKALLRPGRLIAEYEFKNLQPDKATALIKKLYGDDVPGVFQSTSLAEVFNFREELIKTKEKKKVFGFTSQPA